MRIDAYLPDPGDHFGSYQMTFLQGPNAGGGTALLCDYTDDTFAKASGYMYSEGNVHIGDIFTVSGQVGYITVFGVASDQALVTDGYYPDVDWGTQRWLTWAQFNGLTPIYYTNVNVYPGGW